MLVGFIYFILALVGLLGKKSKFVTFVIFAFIFISFGWNYNNADYLAYERDYLLNKDEISVSGEFGFNYINYLCNCLNLNYQQFLVVLGLFCYSLFYYITVSKSKYPGLVASFYLLFFFFLDVTQIRNFLAFIIVLFAFVRYLRIDATKSDIIKYALLVLLSTTIHFSSIFFMVFILAIKEVKFKHIAILTVIASAVTVFVYSFIQLYFSKIITHGEGDMSMLATISHSAVQIFNYFFIKKFSYHLVTVSKAFPISKKTQSAINNIDVLVRCNLLLLCLIPFYFDSAVFTRILRFTAIINILHLSNIIPPSKANVKYILILCVYSLYFHVMFNGFCLHDRVIPVVFNFNLIFSLL